MTSQPVFGDGSSVVVESRRRQAMLAEVREALSRTPREIPPKYFYDERGSRLFEAITALPEYYPTRAERAILDERAGEIVAARPRTLVELGAGSAAKTRVLLDAMRVKASDVTYVPVDVSGAFLEETRGALEREMPALRVKPIVADITEALDLPPHLPAPVLFAFLGSTIGNFNGAEAVGLLRRVRSRMRPGDQFLLGADLRKNRVILEAAYNDAAGVTAEFNRNVLHVLNAELGADFVPEQFAHRAFYNDNEHRIEMHLVSTIAQLVRIPGMPTLALREGEGIRTEVSYKYDRAAIEALAGAARLRVGRWFTDDGERFALSVLEASA